MENNFQMRSNPVYIERKKRSAIEDAVSQYEYEHPETIQARLETMVQYDAITDECFVAGFNGIEHYLVHRALKRFDEMKHRIDDGKGNVDAEKLLNSPKPPKRRSEMSPKDVSEFIDRYGPDAYGAWCRLTRKN